MYKITIKKENRTITLNAEEVHKVFFPFEYYEMIFNGEYYTISPEIVISVKPYKSRESKRGNCTR